jgi:hypothetical protein
MKKAKTKEIVNILTETGEALICKSILLGQEFALEIRIAGDGQLSLSIDGNPTVEDAAKMIATKCDVPVESILPLLIVNLALLTERRQRLQDTFLTTPSPKATIH